MEALALEWRAQAPKLSASRIVSIYFGGGTPTLLGAEAIGTILNWIPRVSDCEITIEANPENATLELLKAYAQAGINRISIGVQSLDGASLLVLERQHDTDSALRAIAHAEAAGIRNISIDLMYDLPNQTLKSWEKTLDQLPGLPITHLSLYNLTIEPHTVFFKRQKSLTPLLPSPEQSLNLLQMATEKLEQLNLKRYEVSAFAKPGYHSRHNTGYWIGRPFLGLGPSAFSYWEKKRFRNIASLSRYQSALANGRSPLDFEEELAYPDNLRELLAVQLRLIEGVDLDFFQRKHAILDEKTREALAQLTARGFLTSQAETIRLTEKGLLFYDSVAEALI